MVEQEIYPNAPAVEAVIDVKFSFPSALSSEIFNRLQESLSDLFPNKENIHSHLITGKLEPEKNEFQTSSSFVGYKFVNEKKDRVLQCQKTGFTYSHLYPYSNWSNFKTECLPILEKFIEITAPTKVTRVAVRYINKFTIKEAGHFRLEDYFNIYPNVPEEGLLQNIMSSFKMKIDIPQNDIQSMASVGMATGFEKDNFFVILDIDIYSNVNNDVSLSWLSDCLEVLRDRKNNVFETAITDKTRELIR